MSGFDSRLRGYQDVLVLRSRQRRLSTALLNQESLSFQSQMALDRNSRISVSANYDGSAQEYLLTGTDNRTYICLVSVPTTILMPSEHQAKNLICSCVYAIIWRHIRRIMWILILILRFLERSLFKLSLMLYMST